MCISLNVHRCIDSEVYASTARLLTCYWWAWVDPIQPTNKSAEERCDEEREKVVRLAGIEPTTLGFGGSDFSLDCGVSQFGFPIVLWRN